MLRQAAVDMENTENTTHLLNREDGYSVFRIQGEKFGIRMLLILSYSFLCFRILWRIYERREMRWIL